VGYAPRTPTRLTLGEWVSAFRRAGEQFLADGCMSLAQQVAYSSVLAFFPAVAFLLGVLGVLHLWNPLESLLATVAPHGVIRFIQGLHRDSRGGTGLAALVIGGAGAVWAASGAMGSVMEAVNSAYDRLETRSFVRRKAVSILLVILFGATIFALAVLIVFGAPLGQAIADKADVGGAFTVAWSIARWPVAFVAILLLFAIVYYFSPNVAHRQWKWISPGSLVGAALWLALSALFTIYATYAGSYSKTYGSIAAGVILLLWLNYSAWAILFGAELNAALDRQADIRAAGGEHAGHVQPARRRR
jgi:membrane protein